MSNLHQTNTVTLVGTMSHTMATVSPERYTHGLSGTNQPGNFFFINLLIAFFATIGGVLILIRLFRLGENHVRHVICIGPGSEHQTYWTRNRSSLFPWIKRNILYAPLWNKRHNKELQLSKAYNVGTLPSRLHATILLLYVLSNITYCLVLDYDQERAAIFAELRGRTGALATFNLIPTILFALRNNPLILLLRVSYDTFNLLHRGIARIAILEALAHVFCWALNAVEVKGWSSIGKSMQGAFIQWGTVATVLLVIMSAMAWSPFRHAYYETFLNTHRLLALVTFIGVYEHLALGSLPQLPYIILVAIFWALEWLARATRIIYYNFARGHQTKVLVEALPREACRLTFHLARGWKYSPGSHVHVYLPKVGWWSSHPFSVAWSSNTDEAGASPCRPALDRSKSSKSAIDVEKAFGLSATVTKLASKTPNKTLNTTSTAARTTTTTTVSCIIRAESGMTRTLFNQCANAPNRFLTLSGAVEGPYGSHESLDSYGTVLLFCGGVGITHQLGYLRRLVEGHRDGTVAARRVVLVWSITYLECLEWVRPFMDEVLRCDGRREVLSVRLHVTRGTVEVSSRSGGVCMFKGRVDVGKTVDEVFGERVGSMAVTVCGPGSFSDDVRFAVRKRVQEGGVDFVEEAFTY